eukprot:2695728-Rhodomonas_salina.3
MLETLDLGREALDPLDPRPLASDATSLNPSPQTPDPRSFIPDPLAYPPRYGPMRPRPWISTLAPSSQTRDPRPKTLQPTRSSPETRDPNRPAP